MDVKQRKDWKLWQKDFVGSKLTTPSGSTLEVIGFDVNDKCICRCSVCSEDTELWGDGMTCTKNNFILGQCCCGCSKHTYWTEKQYKVLVQRECDSRGYIFMGWYGEYKKSKTKLKLHNPKTKNTWVTLSIGCLITAKQGDPLESIIKSKQRLTLSEDTYTERFMATGKFLKGSKFWRVKNLNSTGSEYIWYYTCPKCSNDKYVKSGVCDGVFKIAYGTLKRGGKSCRCSDKFKWNHDQRELQIKDMLEQESSLFLSWLDDSGYLNTKSKFKWVCNLGHVCRTTVNNYLNGQRCKTCANLNTERRGNGNGYYIDKIEDKDYLYILWIDNKYVKIGRSFNVSRRISEISSEASVKKSSIATLKVLTSNHETVYDTEQWLHQELRDRGFEYNKPDGSWSTELFTPDSLPIIEYLLKSTNLTRVDVST